MKRITEGQYALGGLTIFAVWIFVILPLLYYPRQEAPQNKQGAAQGEQKADSIGDDPPSLVALKLLTTAGRHEISAYCAQKPKNQSQDWTHGYICDVKITDAYLAWFNGLLVLVTGGLIFVGFLTIRKMRDTEERQLRAYVFASIADFAYKGKTLQFTINFKNSGQTPAYNFAQITMCNIFAHPMVETDFAIKREGITSVAPLPPGELVTTGGDFTLTPDEAADIKNGRKAFYVFGELTYVDAFKRQRTLVFRFSHNRDFGGGLAYTGDGNKET